MPDLSEKELKELREKFPDINIPDKDLKIDSFNKALEKTIPEIGIKEVKKILKITDKDIADWFGYKNAITYRNAERKKHIENGILELYKRCNNG